MTTTSKFCVGCNQELSCDDFYKNNKGYLIKFCKTCHKSRSIGRSSTLKDRGLCISCGTNSRQEKNSKCYSCWEIETKRTKIWRSCVMQDVINLYGGKCACCNEATFKFLNIDHKNNDGYLERRKPGYSRGGYTFYLKLLRLGYIRDDLQVLCYNCNNGKVRNNGICPHKDEANESTPSTAA